MSVFELYSEKFASFTEKIVLDRADSIRRGKFDLLGFEGLDFGRPVDWHLEPISGKHSPVKHWKQFDELATDETGDKKVVWELNRHQHFFTLGVAYALTGDERYAETFARHLDSWMERNPPGMGINWLSSLEVAFRTISWIWALNFFRSSPALTGELFWKAMKFLHLHGRHLEKYLSTYYSPNTHLTGEALGLYYLGTQLRFFKRAEHWRALGEDILLAELDRQIYPDGGYFEQSTWYHRYTADFYTHFFILRSLNTLPEEKESGEKLGAKLQSLLDFLMYLTRPDGTVPLIGDDDGGRCLPLGHAAPNDFTAALSTGAALFGRGDYKFVAGRFSEETLWLLGADGLESFETVRAEEPEKASFAFESSGYFIMRDGWQETDNYLLVDCGKLGALKGGHGHADALSINLAIGGRTVLTDPGTYTYHESDVLRNYFRTTYSHNTLLIGDRPQSQPGGKFSWETQAEARLNEWISQPRFDFFEGWHNGYEDLDDSPVRHIRSILYLRGDYWIVRDLAETLGGHRYYLNFNFEPGTHPAIRDAENGEECVGKFSAAEVGARIFTFGDHGVWQNRESYVSPIYGKREKSDLMQFVSVGRGTQEFFTFLLPEEDGMVPPEVFETEVSGGRAFVIKYRGYIDLLVIGDGEHTVKTEFFDTNFRFLWTRLSEADNFPEEFVMIEGTHFSLSGQTVMDNSRKMKFATARRFGRQLNFRTPEKVIKIDLPD